jgi:hypothetical protein
MNTPLLSAVKTTYKLSSDVNFLNINKPPSDVNTVNIEDPQVLNSQFDLGGSETSGTSGETSASTSFTNSITNNSLTLGFDALVDTSLTCKVDGVNSIKKVCFY